MHNFIVSALASTAMTPVVPFDATPGAVAGQATYTTNDELNALDKGDAAHAAMSAYWDKVEAIIGGTDTMRAAGIKYLPKFPEEPQDNYNFRLANIDFTNIFRDIAEDLASKPFEQEVALIDGDTAPQEIQDFIEDVDGSGNHISVFAGDTFFNGLTNALDWIFVDYSATEAAEGRVLTRAEEQAAGYRPFWSHVAASNVLEVKSRIIAGEERLSFMRILENDADGKFVRVLWANEFGARYELYRNVEGERNRPITARYEFVKSGPITVGEIPLVPFVTGRRRGRTWNFNPALRDAADKQITLYRDENALKNVKTMAGYPMLVAEGVSPEYEGTGRNKKLKRLLTGPGALLYAPMDGQGNHGTFKWIEPSSETMKFLADDVRETEKQLRQLGKHPLTATSGNITVINSYVAAKKGNSAAQMWAFSLKDALENALVLTAKWMKIEKTAYDPEVFVFTDFDIDMNSEDLAELGEARRAGDLSQDSYWDELKRRGTLRPEFKNDEEKARLLAETPSDGDDLDENGNPRKVDA